MSLTILDSNRVNQENISDTSKNFQSGKKTKNYYCNVPEKGNTKITVHSFNWFKLLYYQCNTIKVLFHI